MPGFNEARLFLSFAGPRVALATLQYSLRLRRWEAAYDRARCPAADAPLETPGRLLEALQEESGARFVFERAALEVVFFAPDLVRLSWEPGRPPLPYALARTEWPETPVRLRQVPGGFVLDSAALRLNVLADGSLEFATLEGRTLRCTQPPQFRLRPDGPAWTDTAALSADEHLLGLGAPAGPLDLRGQRKTFWNTDPGGSFGPGRDPLYMALPVLLGLHSGGSYLIFYENSHAGRFAADPRPAPDAAGAHPAQVQAAFEGGMLRYYWIVGEPQRLLERFTELTGRPPLPPRWSLGYHQSRWGYRRAADIRRVAAEFQRRGLPLSAIHLDIDYMDGYRVFTVDRERFPDLAQLAQDLAAAGVRLVTIIDPGVKCDPDYAVYAQGRERGLFCLLPEPTTASQEFHGVVWPGWSAFPDFTHPEARRWWAGLYPALLDQGVAGIWHDMNEPSSFTVDPRKSLPRALLHHLEGRYGSHLEARNLYGLLMNRAGFEGLQAARPERRPWIVSRSGWVSQQRYAWNWTGDVESSWAALRMTIAMVLGSGLSGLPYTGPDIGGFSGSPSPELYVRWFQLAACLPFFRTHSALNAPPREPWTYGEPYTGIIAEALRLRYRLLPYLYTLAWQASQSGAPLVRPLWWAEPHHPDLWSVDDAFLLGEALLAAPILEPGGTRRAVTLPPGGWYNFWDDTLLSGPGSVELAGELERLPLLVRAGSLLPLETAAGLELHLYAPSAAAAVTSEIYSDAGDGYGPYRVDRFQVAWREDQLAVDHEHYGDYRPTDTRLKLVLHGSAAAQILLNGRPVAVDSDDLATRLGFTSV